MPKRLTAYFLLFAAMGQAEGVDSALSHVHVTTDDMNKGPTSDLDAWRHYLLRADPVFESEFKKAVESFNASQEGRSDLDEQKRALQLFIVQRDSMVSQRRVALRDELGPANVEKITQQISKNRTGTPFSPSNYTCGQLAITCNMTFSLGYIRERLQLDPLPNIGGQAGGTWNLIFDGSMNCPVACGVNPTHTPTLSLKYDGTWYHIRGKGVCGNCYIYQSASWDFTTPIGKQIEMDQRGEVDSGLARLMASPLGV